MALAEAKQQGKTIEAAPAQQCGAVIDMMAALKKSQPATADAVNKKANTVTSTTPSTALTGRALKIVLALKSN